MDEQVIKTIRLPRPIVDATEMKAAELGLTFADVVEALLRCRFSRGWDPSFSGPSLFSVGSRQLFAPDSPLLPSC
jgi:hypothetical protein